jgi:hypothetical protein
MKHALVVTSGIGYLFFLNVGLGTGLGVFRTPAYCFAAFVCALIAMICASKARRWLWIGAAVMAIICSQYGYYMNNKWREKLWRLGVLAPSLTPKVEKQVTNICPRGWHTYVSNNVITFRRESPVLILGKVSNPPRQPNESMEHYLKQVGRTVQYELRLRFTPLISQTQYEQLRATRKQAAARFNQGAASKYEYTIWQQHYEECQVPIFHTGDYTVFIDHWAEIGASASHRIEPRFIEVYPPEANLEVQSVINSVKKLFTAYETSPNTLF